MKKIYLSFVLYYTAFYLEFLLLYFAMADILVWLPVELEPWAGGVRMNVAEWDEKEAGRLLTGPIAGSQKMGLESKVLWDWGNRSFKSERWFGEDDSSSQEEGDKNVFNKHEGSGYM